jgi:hypothetical protein
LAWEATFSFPPKAYVKPTFLLPIMPSLGVDEHFSPLPKLTNLSPYLISIWEHIETSKRLMLT